MRGPDGAISKSARRAMSFIGATLAKSAVEFRQPRNHKVSKRRRGFFIKRERDAICATFDLHDFLAVVIGPGRLPWSFGLAGRERGERDREPFIGSSTHETIAGHAVSQCLLVVATHHPLYQLHPTPAAGLRRGPDRVDQAPWESPRDGDEAGELCVVDAERRHDDLTLESTILKRGGISCPLNEGQILTLAVLFALCHHQVFVAEVTDHGPRGMAKFGKRTDATMAIGDLKPSWTGRMRAKEYRNQLSIGANRFDESPG